MASISSPEMKLQDELLPIIPPEIKIEYLEPPISNSGFSSSLNVEIPPPSTQIYNVDPCCQDIVIEYEKPDEKTLLSIKKEKPKTLLNIKKEEQPCKEENTIELSYNPSATLFNECNSRADSYPGVSRINAELIPIPAAEADQALPETDTVCLRNPHRDSRRRRKQQQPYQPSEENRRKSFSERIREVNLLLKYCKNSEQRTVLLFKKRKLEKERFDMVNRARRSNRLEIPRRTELSNRGEISKKTQTSSESDIFITYNEEDSFFKGIGNDNDEADEGLLCECNQRNVSEVEVRLKSKLKRLEEEMSVAAPDSWRRKSMESKISLLNFHLAQPHICDYQNPETKFNEETLKRQLARLQLLLSIPREKGEDEYWLRFQIKETKSRLAGCSNRTGDNAADVSRNRTLPTQPPESSSHGFDCACSPCKRHHLQILDQLKKISRGLKKN